VKKKSIAIFMFFIFAVLSPRQIFGQTIPSRIDIPGWVKMGMSLAQAKEQAPGNRLTQRPDIKEQYMYAVNDDLYLITIRPDKGLTAFQYGLDFSVRTAIQLFTQVYGEPYTQNDEYVIWMLDRNSRNIMVIRISIHNNNYNYLNAQFFFSNEFD
jgi:hypothetical protein